MLGLSVCHGLASLTVFIPELVLRRLMWPATSSTLMFFTDTTRLFPFTKREGEGKEKS